MSERTYYVLCDDNCKFESMTKEQILTAITQAVSTGEITDVDTGFVTKLKEQNKAVGLQFWVGTQAEYNALDPKPNNTFCIITDDQTEEDLTTAISQINSSIAILQTSINTLTGKVGEIGKQLYYGELEEIGSGNYTPETEIPTMRNYRTLIIHQTSPRIGMDCITLLRDTTTSGVRFLGNVAFVYPDESETNGQIGAANAQIDITSDGIQGSLQYGIGSNGTATITTVAIKGDIIGLTLM